MVIKAKLYPALSAYSLDRHKTIQYQTESTTQILNIVQHEISYAMANINMRH